MVARRRAQTPNHQRAHPVLVSNQVPLEHYQPALHRPESNTHNHHSIKPIHQTDDHQVEQERPLP